MKQILLYIWQLPQHLLGLLVITITGAKRNGYQKPNGGVVWFWEYEPKKRSARHIGVSLGRYIILKHRNDLAQAVLHEYGHSVQSRAWGPLYLLAVGLPSALFNNLWDKVFHKNWTAARRQRWYYGRWPEKQADRLGGVTR